MSCHCDVKNTPHLPEKLVPVGFVYQTEEPNDEEVYDMVDKVINQVLGPEGLSAIIKHGDKVVIKVNIVHPKQGRRGEKGRGCISDPRIVRHVAEKVRKIIGTHGDLKVVDALFYEDANPSLKWCSPSNISFYWAHLDKNGDNAIDDGDICYDRNANGILDGTSEAQLVNLDALDATRRYVSKVTPVSSEEITLCLPKFLRRRDEADGSDEYCDVLINIPVLKSCYITGMTGALKNSYGFRPNSKLKGDTGRLSHSGCYWDIQDGVQVWHNLQNLLNYICAEHLVRPYDLTIMDCLTGNRRGPGTFMGSIVDEYQNVPVDFILTNALLASKDPVALDTVSTVLAGYDPESIGLLETARLNNLGTDDPSYINLWGFVDFYLHREELYKFYGPEGRYPFEDGHGGARVLEHTNYQSYVIVEKPVHVSEGTYLFKYQVSSIGGLMPELGRVELWINHSMKEFHIPNESNHGQFVVNVENELQKVGILHYTIVVWDRFFNCVESTTYFFIP